MHACRDESDVAPVLVQRHNVHRVYDFTVTKTLIEVHATSVDRLKMVFVYSLLHF
jgi:hypothetical protein